MTFKFKILSSKDFIILCVISFFVICTWGQTINFDFLSWDDNYQITKNFNVTNFNKNTVAHNFVKERFTFIPLTVYSSIYYIFGENPVPFHILNIVLHLCNVVLLLFLLKNLTNEKNIVWLVIALFALHPLRVESVAWISETKGLMMAMFSLIAYLSYVKYLKNQSKWYLFFISVFMATAATLSKVPGILVPISLFIFDFYYDRKLNASLILEKILMMLIVFFTNIPIIPVISLILLILLFVFKNKFKYLQLNKKVIYVFLFVGFVMFFYFLYILLSKIDLSLWRNLPESNLNFSFNNRILMSGIALWQYIRFFFVPYPLSAAYSYPILINGEMPSFYILGLLVLIIILILTLLLIIYRNKISKLIIFSWFFFLINISIFLHIFPIEGRVISADRYSYLPSIGLSIILAFILNKYIFRNLSKYLNLIIFSLFILVLSFASYQRTKVWINTQTLFSDVIIKNPNTAFAYNLLANHYMLQQKTDSAIFMLNQSIMIDTNDLTSYYSRGLAYMAVYNADSAICDFNRFVSLTANPKYKALAYAHIGEIHRNTANDSIAMYYLNLAIENDSELALAYNRRGIVWLQKNNLNEASSDFSKAIKFNPNNAEAWNNLGLVFSLKKDFSEAIKNYNIAIEINENYSEAYVNRGFAFLQISNVSSALSDFNYAIIADKSNIDAYINRGRIYAMQNNFTEAIVDFEKAINIDEKNIAAITNRAFAYFYYGDTVNAKNDFIYVTKLDDNNPIVWQNLAWFFTQTKHYNDAIVAFEMSLQKDQYSIAAYIGLAQIYVIIKQYPKIDACANKIMEINKHDANALLQLSEIYKSYNNFEKANYYHKLGNEIIK